MITSPTGGSRQSATHATLVFFSFPLHGCSSLVTRWELTTAANFAR